MELPEQIIRTCDNCRNKDTEICKHFKKMKSDYQKRIDRKGKITKKYCKFWAYEPNGMWRTAP
jgi:hypothetical protein